MHVFILMYMKLILQVQRPELPEDRRIDGFVLRVVESLHVRSSMGDMDVVVFERDMDVVVFERDMIWMS